MSDWYIPTTTITGNAGTATALQTPRLINGVSFNGTADVAVDRDILLQQALGSTMVAQTIPYYCMQSSLSMTDGTLLVQAINLPKAATLNGVKWWQFTQGNYTADQYNGVGLYTYSGGTITLVASSTNDGTIWSTPTTGSLGSKAFSSTYPATAGLYFVAALYNSSAQVAAPVFGADRSGGLFTGDFTNSGKTVATLAAQNSLPTPQVMSGMTAGTIASWFALY